MKKTLLYAEEYENTFIRSLVSRNDINLVLIRFSHCLSFSSEHLKKTSDIPVFIMNTSDAAKTEAERLRRYLLSNNICVDYFFNDSEFNQEYVQSVARIIELPGALSQLQAEIVRDKVVMKDFLKSIGFHCPEYRLLTCFDDVKQCAQIWGYPFIVKWRRSVSSIEVYRIDNSEQLSALDLCFSSNRYMAEKFCPYKIWCIDAIVSNGFVVDNLYTWLPYTNLDFAEKKEKFVQLAVGSRPSFWKFDPKSLTQKIIDELGVGSGYLHLEAFITPDGQPIICEFAWRTPGEHMLSNFSALFSLDVPLRLGDALLGKHHDALKEQNNCVADVFLPLQNGIITEISTIDQLKEQIPILDGEIYYSVGDVLTSKHKYTDSAGWVQMRSDNTEKLIRDIEHVYSVFRFKTRRCIG